MDNEKRDRDGDASFVVHLWLEDRGYPAWRGRITDSGGTCSSAFEDGQSLLAFVQRRLRAISDVVLPMNRRHS